MSTHTKNYCLAITYALTIFVSAFLVFQVQPVISKFILPWFGGAPAVWTTCVLFFQVLLFLGYTYAHVITRWCRPTQQGIIHFSLIVAALLLLPITPGAEWKPDDSSFPTFRILLLLAANVGVPYFLLSSTGPLLQAWFARAYEGRSPYRLYALSNVGSLLALVSYPFLVEPALNVQTQGNFWSVGFCVFALACGYLAVRLWQQRGAAAAARARAVDDAKPFRGDTGKIVESTPPFSDYVWWLALPALASMMLLAVTNHVCQDVAVIPFLWVMPLSLYLISFIICFDNESWYQRYWYAWGMVVTLLSISAMLLVFGDDRPLVLEISLYFAALFFICMVCHGELVGRKPAPRHLTAFYLMCSGGGALGGVFVALVCPIIFTAFWETPLGIIAAYVMGMLLIVPEVTRRFGSSAAALGTTGPEAGDKAASATTEPLAQDSPAPSRPAISFSPWSAAVAFSLFLGLVLVVRTQLTSLNVGAEISLRNFYGVLHVERLARDKDSPTGRVMIHGRIAHGFQYDDPDKRRVPTMYFSKISGIGLVMERFRREGPRRVGVIGLGVGTLAAYAEEGDYFRFYEIDPDVISLAREYFTFLSDSPAQVDLVLGDGRLSLEREPDQHFDILVLDAFSSDAIPVHLLTREALVVYKRHLKPDGVLVVNISSRYLDLTPVVTGLAKQLQYDVLQIQSPGDVRLAAKAATWMVLTNNVQLLHDEAIRSAALGEEGRYADATLWTDAHNNLFQVLK